jgi:anti-sigma regulatory factor (Ser/Thr protein kinase)
MNAPPQWFHERRFAAEALSAGAARRFVRTSLLAHDLRDLVDDVELVVSELATNAMTHAHTPFTVTLKTFDHLVLVVVQDGSQASPRHHLAEGFDTTGRGMAIVGSLSRAWGVSPATGHGKEVWVEFDRDSHERRHQQP